METLLQEDRLITTYRDYAVTTPAPRDVWDELYRADPTALLHQSPTWVDYVCAAGGYEDVSRLYELRNGKQLVLPLVKRKGVPNQLAFAASFPYAWGIGGMLASEMLKAEDIAVICEDLAQAGYLRMSVRPNPLQGKAWAAAQPEGAISVPRYAHVLDLAGGFEEVLGNRITKRTRKHIRRAERADLEVECDTTGRLMPVFYELYEQSLVRWASQQNEPVWLARWRAHRRDPLSKLQKMAQMLGDACRVWVAWHEGQPVASIVTLIGTNASDILGAINKELADVTNANYLLQKLTIEDACKAGCRYYDMGESGNNVPLSSFKERFGAVGYPYADYHLERLPITRMDGALRGFVKELIGFKDA